MNSTVTRSGSSPGVLLLCIPHCSECRLLIYMKVMMMMMIDADDDDVYI